MKIILRQFLVINPDNNEEQRTRVDFATLQKRFKRGQLFLEQCETIPQKGFIYHGAKYRKVLIGEIGKKLSYSVYIDAKRSIN